MESFLVPSYMFPRPPDSLTGTPGIFPGPTDMFPGYLDTFPGYIGQMFKVMYYQ